MHASDVLSEDMALCSSKTCMGDWIRSVIHPLTGKETKSADFLNTTREFRCLPTK